MGRLPEIPRRGLPNYYDIRDDEIVVLVIRIGPRGDVYKD